MRSQNYGYFYKTYTMIIAADMLPLSKAKQNRKDHTWQALQECQMEKKY